MAPKRLLSLAGLLVGSLAAQAPSFSLFGNPCAPVPPLAANNLPRIGQVFQLQVLSAESVAPGSYDGFPTSSALVAGFSNTSWLGLPLPIPAVAIQALGVGACGELSVSAETTRPLPYLYPRVPMTVSLPIPNAPALVGTSIYFQTVDYAFNRHMRLGLGLGQAGAAVIGV